MTKAVQRFTANQAREITVVPSEDYERVIEGIMEKCQEGESSLYWPSRVSKGTKKILEDDGFTVIITNCQRDGDSARITWY